MKTLFEIIRQTTTERQATSRQPYFAPATEVKRRMRECGIDTKAQFDAEIRRLTAGEIIRLHRGIVCDLYEPIID